MGSSAGVAVQVAVALAAFGALALYPPADGRMLLVPLTGASLVETLNLAIARGGRLVGMGPLPGSIVVDADRARIAAPMRRAGILVLAAPPAGCGGLARP